MSVLRHDTPGAAARPTLRLIRRLMVMCPATGRATDTGFELSALPGITSRQQVLVDCRECGQDHRWRIEDVSLE